MKVALAFPGCNRLGGVERVTLETANFLARKGHEAHLFARQWDETELSPGVVVHPVDYRPIIPAFDVPAFVRACEAEFARAAVRFDVTLGFGAASPSDSVVWMPSVHAAWIEISRRSRGFVGRMKQRMNLLHPIILGMEKKLITQRRYRKLIALTSRERDDLVRIYGVPANEIAIIPHGFSSSEFNLDRAEVSRSEVRARLGISETDKVVIFVANELERKGFAPLLRSIAKIKSPLVHLLAVGRLDPAACAKEIRKLGLRGRIHFTGPARDVAGYFAAADIFALPTYYEAWGLVIIEAMACGLPVLTSRLAGASMAVNEGMNGRLLEDPSDIDEISSKLQALLGGAHSCKSDIVASVAEYEWDRVLIQLEEALAACARSPAG